MIFSRLSLRTGIIVLLSSAAVIALTQGLEEPLLGRKPTISYQPSSHGKQKEEKAYTDPTLVRLQQATKATPKDPKVWKAYALALSEKIKRGEIEARKGALDLVDALSQVLRLDENDTDAILLTADLSFDLKAFQKAKEFYERYFQLVKKDNVAAARYASTLTFLGKFHEAKAILHSILEEDPKNFQANAFMAIAFAQQGEIDKAREVGENALAVAPSEEAKSRFKNFLAGLGKKKEPQPPLFMALRSNPIAGPKIVSLTADSKKVIAMMRDFPMHLMPDVAKQKFIRSLQAKRGTFEEVEFIDYSTKETLSTVSLLEKEKSEF